MPIFQYQDYRNPYGPSIAEALQHQADPQAAAALRAGDIQAQAAQRTGALQGQLWSTLGAIPQQIQAQQAARQEMAARAQQLQLGGLQLDAAQREAKSRNLFEAESQNPANQNPDGTMNEDKFLAALRRQDVGAYQKAIALQQANQKASLDWTKGIADLAASSATADEKRAAALKLRQDYLGTQALGAYTALQQQPDDPLHARDWALGLATRAVADNAVSPGVANQWIRQLAAAGPDQVGAALLSAVPPEMKAKYDKEQAEAAQARAAAVKPITVGAGDTAISPPNPNQPLAPPTVYYTAPPKDTVKPGTAEDWVARARRVATAQNGGVPLTDAQLQAVDTAALQSFKITNQDPEMRDAALAQRNIAQALAQLQVNQTPTAAQAASVAEDLVAHRIAPEQLASLFSTRGREGLAFKLAVTAEAKKLDPQFNFQEAAANYQLVKSPAFQNTVRYMDSVQESIPRLLQNASALGRGPITSLNQLANMAASQFNDTQFARLKTDAVLVGDEVAKLLAGGGSGSATSDAKMRQGMELINTAASVPALAAALEEIQALVGFRRQALTRGTYLEGTSAGTARTGPPAAAPAAPTLGEIRSQGGERRMWDGGGWVPVK
jgi:hypothetical protein